MKKDFLAVSDYTPAELQGMLDLAIRLKQEWQAGGNEPLLKNKVLGMIFQKPSLRTRVSFDMAMRHLGGDALYLSPNEIGLGLVPPYQMGRVYRDLLGWANQRLAREADKVVFLAAGIPITIKEPSS
mgnify:CR=1 FL=1